MIVTLERDEQGEQSWVVVNGVVVRISEAQAEEILDRSTVSEAELVDGDVKIQFLR